ncbi:hypothetical protein Halhy_6207 [Haliscomenobacter hydrossis DSM 1100]|uniref:Uncharacterized protein n=1 Tax=Haliscomenobacter hydrossis (strain ATCC 27775 / DSM 1100 / LMG 10767 / O) TaxID=760192 RepID=F4L4W6_HALH1|nr:hypothetical protein Halhy_6207 [Haliscomenobacter hydrossis DSM 1100]
MKKFIGKPYAGKPHVRIDEGEKRQRRFSLLYCESVVNKNTMCYGIFKYSSKDFTFSATIPFLPNSSFNLAKCLSFNF